MAPQADPQISAASSASLAALLDGLVAEQPETLGRVTQLRELMLAHERREAELSALYEAARDLTKVRDLEHALQAVTDRTRRLLACDVAYLSARTDDVDHFAVRAWAGQLSPAFLGTRVSVGSGVGGEVASSRRPFQVANYQETDAFAHSEYLDRQVSTEGIVALLGVPLEVDGRLLGILFAARRRSEPFTDRQVDLVSSLAAHAAVALDNAFLFNAQMEALSELEATTVTLRAHTAAVETSAEVHGRLTAVLLRGDGIDRIVSVVAEALDGAVAMVDDAGLVLASSGDVAPVPPYPLEVTRALEASREAGRSVHVAAFDGRQWHVSAASAGNRYLGAVVLTVRRELTDVDIRTLERATQTIALSLLADVAAVEADIRAAGETMRMLLAERRADLETVQRLARRHGLLGREVSVVVSEVSHDRLARQLAACAALCRTSGGLSALHDDHIVVITPMEAEEAAERLWQAMRTATGEELTVAAAGNVLSPDELHGSHREATQCLRLMRHLGRAHEWATSAEFGVYSLLLTPGAGATLDRLIRRTVGSLLEYDDRHHTDLAATALAYLDCSTNATAAAAHIGVHVNTVTQRLARIDRVLGPTWRGSRQLDIHHALRLHRLRPLATT
ncbi:helix-turn-helix domain-containing protein [Nocardioides lijunqiniae]|uniref:helix-turn-helix domain-containing protein n=1 Tax=Nocardioides lijunqiniae TaxID=2760832 RepID=UPI001878A1A1|nr:GAF domain-containing protein [Nocardioides lijunqiniae]